MKEFARITGMRYHEYDYKLRPGTRYGRVAVGHQTAAKLANMLLPYLKGTDKGDQILRVARQCTDYKIKGGLIECPGRRSQGMRGNQNAKGKSWKLSEETKQRQREAWRRRKGVVPT